MFLGHFAYIFWIEMKDHGVAETSTWETKPHTWRVEELRFIMLGRPRGVNTPSSEPQAKGYRVFIHGQAWVSGFAGAGWLQRAGQGWVRWIPVPSIVSPHFLRLHDLRDPDFARNKLSYIGRRSRRLCKIFTFPLVHGISRQEYWSGLPFPSPGNLPDSGIKLQSPSLETDS